MGVFQFVIMSTKQAINLFQIVPNDSERQKIKHVM